MKILKSIIIDISDFCMKEMGKKEYLLNNIPLNFLNIDKLITKLYILKIIIILVE